EVAVLDVRRLAGREALHHAPDERQMPPEDFLARARHRGGMRERRAPTTDPRASGWSEGGVGAAHARAVAFGSRRRGAVGCAISFVIVPCPRSRARCAISATDVPGRPAQ